MIKYWYTKFLDNLKNQSNQIIQCFYSNLSNELKKLFAKNFFWRNIYIWVCIKVVDLDINIPNVLDIIYWKFYKHFTFLALLKSIRYIIYSIRYTRITTIFIESKHILQKKLPKNSDFVTQNSIIVTNREKKAYTINSHLYKLNIQVSPKKQLNPYHKVNLTIFRFMNIVDC